VKYLPLLLIYCFQVLPLFLSSEKRVTDEGVMVLTTLLSN